MVSAAGSRMFFQSIEIPGVEKKVIQTSPGCVHITLMVCEGRDPKLVRKRYLDACTSQIPIGQEVTVSTIDSGR